MKSVARQVFKRSLIDTGPVKFTSKSNDAKPAKRGNAVLGRPPTPTIVGTSHIVSPSVNEHLGGYNENKADMRKATTTQYYRDHDIHKTARHQSFRLIASALLQSSKFPEEADAIRTAQYLQSELPVRVAHRIKGFHNLPFIIVTNPRILGVMELYMRSFKIITSFNGGKKIQTYEEVKVFEQLLERLLEDHGDVIDELTKGFAACYPHVFAHFYKGGQQNEQEALAVADDKASALVKKFLDRTFTSRLGIRMLAQHHLLLSDQLGKDSRGRIGIVQARWKPQKAIEAEAYKVRDLWKQKCDNPPRVIFNGHTEAQFPYIPMGVDYILQEVFKNAYRATIESYVNSARTMPAIDVTIAVNKETFTIRISDRGKGIPPDIMNKIWRYGFTTTDKNNSSNSVGDLLSMASGDSMELAGYGVGLPIARAYAEYLGGSLEIRTLEKIGTDVYLTLKHIDPMEGHSFRI